MEGKTTRAILENLWFALVDPLKGPDTIRRNVWRLLQDCYQQKDRYYHNFDHIYSMLTMVESPKSVQFAVWFHDIIYDSKSSKNEEESALVADHFLPALGATSSLTDKVVEMILATKTHECPPDDHETNLLLDLDLAILGSSPEQYQKYALAIRKEYAWVPEQESRQGRTKVLKHFLARPNIYRTEHFQKSYEELASSNMQFELASLSSLGMLPEH